MSGDKDILLLSEFKKAFKKSGSVPYSNLDDSFAEKFDFFIKRYEEIIEVTGTHIPPHRWSYHRIGLLLKGEAVYTCGIYRFTAKKNTLIIIPARVITTSDWGSHCSGYHLLFKFDFLLQNNLSYKSVENKGILQPSVQPYLPLDDAQSEQLAGIFEAILREKEASDPFKNELIALKIVELLILCERLYGQVQDIEHNYQTIELLKNFTNLIEQHFCQERSVGYYASRLHVHPNYLNAVIKANTGITAKESIQNRILIEAKYLLHTTNLSVKEIANRIGFGDPNYFTAFFKRLEKTSPAAYRSFFI
jgi:AraC family transcriptional activator of pobA